MAANTIVGTTGAAYPSNLIVQSNRPLDDRTCVASKDKLLQYTGYIYKGMLVSVQSDSTLWMLKDVAKASDSDYSGWVQLSANIFDSSGMISSSLLPSYVDDVIEGYYNSSTGKFYKEAAYTTQLTGETGKIYVDLNTNYSYRYSSTSNKYALVSAADALEKANRAIKLAKAGL